MKGDEEALAAEAPAQAAEARGELPAEGGGWERRPRLPSLTTHVGP